MPHPKPTDVRTEVRVRVAPDLRNALVKLARARQWTLSRVVDAALRDYVAAEIPGARIQ